MNSPQHGSGQIPAGDLAFILVVERGPLESQALLLVESVRTFAGPHRDATIWAVQPRTSPPPSRITLDRLAALDAIFLRADLNRAWPRYPLANKPAAAAFAEGAFAGRVRALVLLDSDTVVLHPPTELELPANATAAIRPVDRSLIGSPVTAPVTPFWDRLYRECGVQPNRVWDVSATVDQGRVRAYFNTGLIAVRPEAAIFHRWNENLARLSRDHALDRFSPKERWFVEQACFAATLLAETDPDQVRILDRTYNYPVHLHRELPASERLDRLEDATVVHYHRAFYGTAWWRDIPVGEPYATWLRRRLPLPGLHERIRQSRTLRRSLRYVRGLSTVAMRLRARHV